MTTTEMPNSVFVRGLSYDADDQMLEEFFSEVGPVRRAFVIREKRTRESRGFGFVQYALEEDAHRAVTKMNNTLFMNSMLTVSLALRKGEKPPDLEKKRSARLSGSKEKKKVVVDPTELEEKKKEVSLSKDRNAVVVWGWPEDEPLDALKAVMCQQGKVLKEKFPLSGSLAVLHPKVARDLEAETDEKDEALILPLRPISRAVFVYEEVKGRSKAKAKLSGKKIAGHRIAVRRGEAILGPVRAKARARVVIRNLPFTATPQDLAVKFAEYGPLYEVRIPRVSVDGKLTSRGFAFVTFTTREDAVFAVRSVNGKKIKDRTVAVDFALPKDNFLAKEKENADEEKEDGEDVEGEDGEDVGGEDGEDFEGEDGKDFEGEDGKDFEGEDDKEEEEETETTKKYDDDEEDDDDSHVDDEKAKRREEQERREMLREKKIRGTRDVVEGRTLFLRSVPVESSEEDIVEAFSRFGKVHHANVVRDKATGMSMGKAFVEMESAEGVEAALEASRPAGDVGRLEKLRRGQKTAASASITAELTGGGITMRGRRLVVNRAVPREDAEQLRKAALGQEGERKERWEKRHLYLAREGASAGPDMPKVDADKRERAAQERKTRLRSNFFFISPTRLSVRNLGKAVTEHDLRGLMLDAARKGADRVKRNEGDPSLRPPPGKPMPKARVRKVIIMRDAPPKQRAPGDPLPASKGFGFVDFEQHVHALAALRELDNNPEYSKYSIGPDSRLIIQFTVEDMKKLMVKENRVKRSKDQQDKLIAIYGSLEAAAQARKKETEKVAKGHQGINPKSKDAITTKPTTGKRSRDKISTPSPPQSKRHRAGRPQRNEDAALDAAAAAAAIDGDIGAANAAKAQKKRKRRSKEKDEEQHHEKLVDEYRKSLF